MKIGAVYTQSRMPLQKRRNKTMKLNIAGEMKEYPDDMTVQEWMDYTDVPNQEGT